MKIVVNRCWGGFGLSRHALLDLVKRNSPGIEKVEDTDGFYRRISKWTEFVEGYEFDGWQALYKDGIHYTWDRSNRTDDVLIAVVEELGEAANGPFSELEIVEIPDDVKDYHIRNYDGMESVEEDHRSW